MKHAVTSAMVDAVRAGTHELILFVRPQCKSRVRAMQRDPLIGPYADAMTDDDGCEQVTESTDVAEWLRQHPLCGIGAWLMPAIRPGPDGVPF